MIHGVGGHILWVNLTKGSIEKRPLDEDMIREKASGN